MNGKYYSMCTVIYIIFALIAFYQIGENEDETGFQDR
jgi:hypothetical protein